jgi:glycerol-3-phosphate acyltransferase PlsY
MYYALVILCAYLIGSSSLSFYISKWKGIDIREKGSKNLGASNAMVVLGWIPGIAVAIHDIGKAVLCVLLAQYFFPSLPYIGAVAGVASVLGHIFPFYLKFKGGKGFASYIGMTFALSWKLGLIICLIVVLAILITDFIVVATTLTVLTVPIYLGIAFRSNVLLCILLVATVVIILKHRVNYVRIIKGTEIGFRSANKGEHRA